MDLVECPNYHVATRFSVVDGRTGMCLLSMVLFGGAGPVYPVPQ